MRGHLKASPAAWKSRRFFEAEAGDDRDNQSDGMA